MDKYICNGHEYTFLHSTGRLKNSYGTIVAHVELASDSNYGEYNYFIHEESGEKMHTEHENTPRHVSIGYMLTSLYNNFGESNMSEYARKLDGTSIPEKVLLAEHDETNQHLIQWTVTGNLHTICYGLQVTEFTNRYEAAHHYGECITHSLTCAGKLD